MSYIPKYTITNAILKNVGLIDAAREIIDNAPLVPAWERRFRASARTRIIHHGTHLEGNSLNFSEVEKVVAQNAEVPPENVVGRDRDLQEVINYRAVMEYIDSLENTSLESPLVLSENMLKEIHVLTVERLLPPGESGKYRRVKVVIRNTTSGEITFRPPPPIEVESSMSDLFAWLSSPSGMSCHPLLRAGILHYELVRIHPFTDGNGRASRAMALLLLFLENYKIKKFFALEDYYDSSPVDYYQALKSVSDMGGDLTSWLEYFILGISIEFNRIKETVQKLSLDLKLKSTIGGKQIALSDRQIRLIEFIERHGTLGMSDGRELLPNVSDDTVLRDLRDLVEKKLILKKGHTKGAKYYLVNQ